MTIKDVLVYVDHDGNATQRIRFARELAAHHDAHLTGIYVRQQIILPAYVDAQIPAEVTEAAERGAEERVVEAERKFTAEVEGSPLRWEWRALKGHSPEVLSRFARFFDLLVLPQRDVDDTLLNPGFQPDEVTLESGRPALIVPYAGSFDYPARHAIVAWNGTRESARALHDALPLLMSSEQISVVTIGAHADEGSSGADIAGHLARHGLKVQHRHLSSDEIAPGDVLLSYAADRGAQLLVMGAYGHSRLRETVLGGMTRHLLEHMTLPVLMAH